MMETHELVVEMKLLERRLTLYEEKCGILSEDFHIHETPAWRRRFHITSTSRRKSNVTECQHPE
jgi:hypothetical protein